MAQNTSSIIRIVAVAGTLLVVGLIGIERVFTAAGLITGLAQRSVPDRLWAATWSLARVLLPLVLVSYLFLFRRGQQSPLQAWNRWACWAVAFAVGLVLAVTLDPNITSRLWSFLPEFVPRLAEPLVGICLAVLVFSPENLRDLVFKELAPADPGLEERVLSLYFGFLSGLLLYLVFMEIWWSSIQATASGSSS